MDNSVLDLKTIEYDRYWNGFNSIMEKMDLFLGERYETMTDEEYDALRKNLALSALVDDTCITLSLDERYYLVAEDIGILEASSILVSAT